MDFEGNRYPAGSQVEDEVVEPKVKTVDDLDEAGKKQYYELLRDGSITPADAIEKILTPKQEKGTEEK